MDGASKVIHRCSKFLNIATLGVVLIAGVAPCARARVNDEILTACAAFASNGGLVSATTNATNLSAEISDPAGNISRLNMSLVYPAADNEPPRGQFYSCQAYFDRQSDLIAIGLSYGYRLRVGVADAKHAKWIGDWTVEPASGIYKPFLAGFLEGTTTVVVAGEPSMPTNYGLEIRHGSFWSLLFNSQGQQVGSMPTTRDYGSSSDLFPHFADASHNRLWVFRCVVVSAPWLRQPDCPVDWVTLVGDASSPPEFDPRKAGEKRTDFWMSPGTFAALDGNAIVVAETSTVWLVDMEKQTLSRLTIPKRFHFPRFEEIHAPAVLSPDGQVVAVPLVSEAVAFPYLADNYVYKGTDFAVVQLHPFQLLDILPGAGPNSLPSCAIDDREGHIVALIFRQNHWERTELKRSSPP